MMTLAMWVGAALAYGWAGGILMGLTLAAMKDENMALGEMKFKLAVIAFSTLFWPLEIGWVLYMETKSELSKRKREVEPEVAPWVRDAHRVDDQIDPNKTVH